MLDVIKPQYKEFSCYCSICYAKTKRDGKRCDCGGYITAIPFRDIFIRENKIARHAWWCGSAYLLLKEYFRSFYGIYSDMKNPPIVDFKKIVKTITYTFFNIPKSKKVILDMTIVDTDMVLTIKEIKLFFGGEELILDL
nr:MAG TPA: hypothetical protein [Caudoviricetes sp.]